MIILDGYKLSYNAFDSLRNSGQNKKFKSEYLLAIFFVYPTGTVDLITTIADELYFIIFSTTNSMDDVSNCFVLLS